MFRAELIWESDHSVHRSCTKDSGNSCFNLVVAKGRFTFSSRHVTDLLVVVAVHYFRKTTVVRLAKCCFSRHCKISYSWPSSKNAKIHRSNPMLPTMDNDTTVDIYRCKVGRLCLFKFKILSMCVMSELIFIRWIYLVS